MRKKKPGFPLKSVPKTSAFERCRAQYLDDSHRVIQIKVPWRGQERRQSGNRRCTLDRRAEIRYELVAVIDRALGDRRSYVDRREVARQFDSYRLAKFDRLKNVNRD